MQLEQNQVMVIQLKEMIRERETQLAKREKELQVCTASPLGHSKYYFCFSSDFSPKTSLQEKNKRTLRKKKQTRSLEK